MTEKEKSAERYTRVELCASGRFSGKEDVLAAVLAKNKTYTCREAEAMMKRYMERMI